MEWTEIIASEILLAVNCNDIHILFQEYSPLEAENNWSLQRGGKTHVKEADKKNEMEME
jgi:hypothetical protein